MDKIRLSILTFLLLAYFSPDAQSQEVEYIRIPELENILKNPDNKLFVINFWASWCPPCVKEFPHFEKVSKEYESEKVEFIMVSLDFPNQVEKQLIPFLKKNKTSLKVAVMMDVDYNAWIDKVEPKWQGEIPATLFLNNAKKVRHFHSGEVDESELRNLIKTYM